MLESVQTTAVRPVVPESTLIRVAHLVYHEALQKRLVQTSLTGSRCSLAYTS